MTEAARVLRVLLEDFPPTTSSERATARRIEGAAIALEVVQQTIGSETIEDHRPLPR